MLGILRQKVGAGSSSAMTLGQRIRPATSAMRGFASSAKEVLLGDVGAGKSSLVLRFVKEQFVEFQVCSISFKGRIFYFIHTFTFIVCYYKNQLPPLFGGIIFTTHSKQ
ncbi:uncharacterized protein LOC126617622 isoform X2 [Malus sylvestris]|nr:uncharacterized protein LOC108170253 isoform X3 [Malus domestica]XP_050141670.1 uncharacterized protein LOC126617622 isoform X2 [Malus sylvestris]